EVRPALAHHVRDVQVAEPPVAELADLAAPAGHPVLVAEPPVRAQRHDHDVLVYLGVGALRADGQLDGLARAAGRPAARPPRPVRRRDRPRRRAPRAGSAPAGRTTRLAAPGPPPSGRPR